MTHTLPDQDVTVYGLTITLDIEVQLDGGSPAMNAIDRDTVGLSASLEVEGFEFCEDDALAQLMMAYVECDIAVRPFGITFGQESEIRKAIAEAVLAVVEKAEITEEEVDHV